MKKKSIIPLWNWKKLNHGLVYFERPTDSNIAKKILASFPSLKLKFNSAVPFTGIMKQKRKKSL
jgi:hypothetical protein